MEDRNYIDEINKAIIECQDYIQELDLIYMELLKDEKSLTKKNKISLSLLSTIDFAKRKNRRTVLLVMRKYSNRINNLLNEYVSKTNISNMNDINLDLENLILKKYR